MKQYEYKESTIEADLYEHIRNNIDLGIGWEVAFLGAYGVTTPDPTGGFMTRTTFYVYMQRDA